MVLLMTHACGVAKVYYEFESLSWHKTDDAASSAERATTLVPDRRMHPLSI